MVTAEVLRASGRGQHGDKLTGRGTTKVTGHSGKLVLQVTKVPAVSSADQRLPPWHSKESAPESAVGGGYGRNMVKFSHITCPSSPAYGKRDHLASQKVIGPTTFLRYFPVKKTS